MKENAYLKEIEKRKKQRIVLLKLLFLFVLLVGFHISYHAAAAINMPNVTSKQDVFYSTAYFIIVMFFGCSVVFCFWAWFVIPLLNGD